MKLIDAEKLSTALYKAWNENQITNEDYIAFRQMVAESEESEISERATPKLPDYQWDDPQGDVLCPVCGRNLLDEFNDFFSFCPDCGQAIDLDID